MPTYVVLMNWTDQRISGVRDSVHRFSEGRANLL
jgi:uncharacterized protein with GYD domain